MKILVDTNVFLEYFLEREDHRNAFNIFKLVEIGQVEGYIAEITLNNIWYVAKRMKISAPALSKMLLRIIDNFEIISVDNSTAKIAAIKYANNFEDGLQLICGEQEGCNYLVTKDLGDFQKLSSDSIKIISPYKFLKQFLRESL